jgi:release factor glutamine methyltransferase
VDDRIQLVQSDLLTCVDTRFDLVCANLPYIPTHTLKQLEVGRYEPLDALDGGMDGLNYIGRLLRGAPRWMANGGLLLLEIEAGQGDTATGLVNQILGYGKVRLIHDLANRPRILRIQF